MRRIGVVGRCQSTVIGDAMRHMIEDCEVFTFAIQDVHIARMQSYAEKVLPHCEIVFSHILAEDHGYFSTRNLLAECRRIVPIPPIVFSGFHPDCVDLIVDGTGHPSPLGGYHSAIVAAAYSLDMPAERVETLFNRLVYKRLGYFDEFGKARTHLHNSMRDAGLDIAREWPDWVKSGTFMHTYNHPRSRVLASLAKLLAVKAGLASTDIAVPDIGFDFLSIYPVWPVYPELAEALGVAGSYIFKKNGTPEIITGRNNLLSLREMIRESYDLYAEIPARVFGHPIIAKTRAALSALLFEKGW